jgi:SSS family solute:Na+ symporter
MATLLVMVAIYTIMGGMLSVLVTDYFQFIIMSIGLLAVTYLILTKVGWSQIVATVEKHHGAGGFNPLLHEKMGLENVLGQTLVQIAVTLTWQTTIARLMAAKDTWTGRKIYIGTSFFFVCSFLIPGIWGIAALASLSPEQMEILSKDPDSMSLHAMPMFLGTIVPVGLMGLLIAAMLAADMSTDSTYMISWAAVIYNDILAPLRRRADSERLGLLINRMIVALIGVFLLFYGLLYKLEGRLWDYLTTTGTVYLSSMSVLLIACCYWKGANNWGAAAAIVMGATPPISYLVLEKLIATSNGALVLQQEYGFTQDRSKILAFVLAAAAMVIFSKLKPKSTPQPTHS